MKLPELTKPMKGVSWWLWRLLIHINFAKSLCWSEQNYNRTQQNSYLFSIHTVVRPRIKNGKLCRLSALTVVFGPFKIMFGLADR